MERRHEFLLGLALFLGVLTFADTQPAGNATKTRDGKFLSLFQVVTFPNDYCEGSGSSNQRNGTCYTSEECTSKGGSSSGTCAQGFGICCVFQPGCGSTTSQNNTYLVETSVTSTSPSPCTYTICKCQSNICRIRFDFTTFDIEGPQTATAIDTAVAPFTSMDGTGDCMTDTMSINSPGNMGSPVICGFNTGQHMIVDASPECNTVSFDISGGSTSTRSWDIKVTQYACGEDTFGGPDNCLQYFTGTSGTVASYNFPTASSTVGSTVTHLSNQMYHMCFRRESGYCAICFTPSIQEPTSTATAQASFGISIAAADTVQSQVDTSCETDYLLLPGSQNTPIVVGTVPVSATEPADRLCGRVFNALDAQDLATTYSTTAPISVCTQRVPFRMTFKTDEIEVDTSSSVAGSEKDNVPSGFLGFKLDYKQISC